MVPHQLPEVCHRHLGVLVQAQDVLHLLQTIDQAPRGLAVDGLEEFHRVADPLALDPQQVQVAGKRLLGDGIALAPHRAPGPAHDVGSGHEHRRLRGWRAAKGPPLKHPRHPGHQTLVPSGIERPKELAPRLRVMVSQETNHRMQRGPLFDGHLPGPLGNLLELEVQVAELAEERRHPLELPAQRLGPHGERVAEQPDGGPHPPDRHPHVVDLFGVLAQARSGLVGQERGELRAERRERHLPHGLGLVDPGRAQVRRRGRAEAGGQEPRLELRPRRRGEAARRLEFLHERPEVVTLPVHHLVEMAA